MSDLPDISPDEFAIRVSEAIRRMSMPPGWTGLLAWGSPEAECRQRAAAWARYDMKQSLARTRGDHLMGERQTQEEWDAWFELVDHTPDELADMAREALPSADLECLEEIASNRWGVTQEAIRTREDNERAKRRAYARAIVGRPLRLPRCKNWRASDPGEST